MTVVSRWLQSALAGHTQIYGEFATLLWSINSCMDILYHGPWYLSNEDCARVRTLGQVFMKVYMTLATRALRENVMMWRCRPKLHLLQHIFRCHRRINAAKYATWIDEDWLKKVSKTLKLVNATTAQERILQRWLLAVPLHLQRCMNDQ